MRLPRSSPRGVRHVYLQPAPADNRPELARAIPPLGEAPMRPAYAFLLACLLTAPAGAGEIHGSVKVPPPPPEDAQFRPYAGRASSLPEPARQPKGAVTDAVIY